MTTNPVSFARRSAHQRKIEVRTSQRLSRLRKIRNSQRNQAELERTMPYEDVMDDALEEDSFVDNPMMKR